MVILSFSFLVHSWILKYLYIPRSHASTVDHSSSIPSKVGGLAFLNSLCGIPSKILLHLDILGLHLSPLLSVWEPQDLVLGDLDENLLHGWLCDSFCGMGGLSWVRLLELILTLFLYFRSQLRFDPHYTLWWIFVRISRLATLI